MGKVINLPGSHRNVLSSYQLLEQTKARHPEKTLIVGIDQDGDFFLDATAMLTSEAVWLLEVGKHQLVTRALGPRDGLA